MKIEILNLWPAIAEIELTIETEEHDAKYLGTMEDGKANSLGNVYVYFDSKQAKELANKLLKEVEWSERSDKDLNEYMEKHKDDEEE